MTHSMEHRWGRRVAAELAVVIVRDGGMRGVGRIENVSLSGALLTTALDIPLHTNITVSVLGAVEPREIPACVVRLRPGGLAIEWRDMASPQIVELIQGIAPDGTCLETHDSYAA
jgi:hypothetical protein